MESDEYKNNARLGMVILCLIALLLSSYALYETRRLDAGSKSRLSVHLIQDVEVLRVGDRPGQPILIRNAREVRGLQRQIFEVKR